MIRLDQKPGYYYLRFASYPNGDMQQVLEGQAIVSYNVRRLARKSRLYHARADFPFSFSR